MRILITRPKEDAEATAEILRARGHEPVIAPLLEIRYLPDVKIPSDAKAILATSANGIRAFAKCSPRRDFPVFAVGQQTAEAAKQSGFNAVISADGDVDDLAQLVMRSAPKRGVLLHAAGSETRGALAEKLRSDGFTVETATLYAAIAATEFPHDLSFAEIDAALFYSPRSATIFATLVKDMSCEKILACCISGAAATALDALRFREVRVAGRPNQENLLAQLG